MNLNEDDWTRKKLLNIASHFSDQEGTCLLFSDGQPDTAKHSYLFLFPCEQVIIKDILEDPWNVLKKKISFSGVPFPEWAGFICYEMGAYSDLEKTIPHISPTLPYAYFLRYSVVFIVDHNTNQAKAVINNSKEYAQYLDIKIWKCLAEKFIHKEKNKSSLKLIEPFDTIEEYVEKINRAKELINAGEIYQVNISQKAVFQTNREPFSLFIELMKKNPVPFACFLQGNHFQIVSCSPERLLEYKQGYLETRPIKGTIKRCGNTLEDELLYHQLMNSEKEYSELMMITDLMRNDLGRVSDPGSVKVKELRRCEAYTNLFHTLSIIQSKADSTLDPIDLIRACFPGGSITGCPKLRSMEVIYDLEKRARGLYTGSIGYFMGNGEFDFNISIRTILFMDDKIDIQLGGGITISSNPIHEYEETLQKGRSLFQILEQNLT